MTNLTYCKERLELLKNEMGSITHVVIGGNNIYVEFENGMNLQIHQEEIKYQAICLLESKLDDVKNL